MLTLDLGFSLPSSVFNRRKMAYTPSPQPGFHGLGATGLNTTQPIRASDTPPFQHSISKRDKRRLALSDRLTEISTDFTNNREAFYRAHMHTLQLDMNYINNANLYENKPLEDSSEDILEGLSANIPGSSIGSRPGVPGLRLPEIEAPPRAGRWAAKFVHEVNDEFEERDVRLTLLAVCVSRLCCNHSESGVLLAVPPTYRQLTNFPEYRRITIPRFEILRRISLSASQLLGKNMRDFLNKPASGSFNRLGVKEQIC